MQDLGLNAFKSSKRTLGFNKIDQLRSFPGEY